MCGRFSLTTSPIKLTKIFRLSEIPRLDTHYNIFPGSEIAVIKQTDHQRTLDYLHWGLIPPWAEDPKMGYRTMNARAEKVHKSPAFRSAFRNKRCLIPADGFYEWQKLEKGKKQPYYIRSKDEAPFAFAGLWEKWQGKDGKVIESCTIITTESNELIKPIHYRMPLILKPGDYELWLDLEVQEIRPLQVIMKPYPEDKMKAYPVSATVNNPINDIAECIDARRDII